MCSGALDLTWPALLAYPSHFPVERSKARSGLRGSEQPGRFPLVCDLGATCWRVGRRGEKKKGKVGSGKDNGLLFKNMLNLGASRTFWTRWSRYGCMYKPWAQDIGLSLRWRFSSHQLDISIWMSGTWTLLKQPNFFSLFFPVFPGTISSGRMQSR